MSGKDAIAPIDGGFLARQTDNDATLQDELLAMFIEQAQAVAASLRAMDADPLRLHRLKGAAWAIGAAPLAAALDRLEAEITTGCGQVSGGSQATIESLLATVEAACCFAANLRAEIGAAALAKAGESR